MSSFFSKIVFDKFRKLLLLLLLVNAIFCLFFLFTSNKLTGGSELALEDEQWISSPVHLPLATDYLRLLLSHGNRLFLLEPFYLVAQLNSSRFSQLKRRFRGFPADWPSTPTPLNASVEHLSVGIFADHFEKADFLSLSGHNFHPLLERTCPATDRLTSITYQNKAGNLYLHLVLFYRFEGHFWARFARSWKGSDDRQVNKSDDLSSKLFIPPKPEPATIFDPFRLLHINGISFPGNIEHYLSQLPTARLLDCTEESHRWMAEKGVARSAKMEAVFRRTLSGMKALARRLEMEVWIASGTLLGWYRQCSVTPYTTDTDFASWSAYVRSDSLASTTALLKRTAAGSTNLRMLQRFGQPASSLEYSFSTIEDDEKVDLFFVYQNQTSLLHSEEEDEFLSPLHDVQQEKFTYQRYPSYSLCSVLLLGLKVLAPCTPREVIIAEYGPQWREPIARWDYTASPVNFAPQGWVRWSSVAAGGNETQYERF